MATEGANLFDGSLSGKGIDVEVLGVQRDNLTLPEYKAAMQKVEKLEHQAVKIEENNQRLAEQAEKLVDQIAKLDEKEKITRMC